MNSIVLSFSNLIIHSLPETRCYGLKRVLLRLAGVKVGKNVHMTSSARIMGFGELIIGDNTWIGHEALIISSSKVEIGACVDIAPRVYIGNGTHEIDVNSDHVASTNTTKDVRIGNGCWLGTNAIILPGVTIGNKCVVAAGSVVTKSIYDDKVLIAGVPAIIKKHL